jgi:hypothetical protein
MIYQFDFPLTLRADIGVIHQPFGVTPMQQQWLGGQNVFQGVYLKNLQAVYKPTKDITIGLSVQQIPQGQLFWGNPWGMGGIGMMRDPSLGMVKFSFMAQNRRWLRESSEADGDFYFHFR